MLISAKGLLINVSSLTINMESKRSIFSYVAEGLGLTILLYALYYILFAENYLFQRNIMGGHYLSQILVAGMLLLLVSQIPDRKKALLFLLLPFGYIAIHEVIWNSVYILYFK